MKSLKLIALLAALPVMAHASVTLTSDDTNLLVNNRPAQLVKSLYDGNGVQLKNVELLKLANDEIEVLLTIDGKSGGFMLRPYEYSQPSTGMGEKIYNASCEEVGTMTKGFYNTGYQATRSGYGDGANYVVKEFTGSVSGYDIQGLDIDHDDHHNILPGQDCGAGKPVTGLGIQYSQSLTDGVNSFFDNLVYPLSIK